MKRRDKFITGKYYWIYNSGLNKQPIFNTDSDYHRFMILLYLVNSKNKSFRLDDLINKQKKSTEEIFTIDKGDKLVSIGAWCVMPNYFNLFIKQETDGGISKFMKKLCTGYSMYFNIKEKRKGPLFDGLFKSKMLDEKNAEEMKKLFAYIHLNLLDMKFSDWENEIKKSSNEMVKFIESYPYSSYLDYDDKNRPEKKIISPENFPNYLNN
ncbi:transposase [Candidatus Nomurabacteria bacterium]|nr:transposase [Candidatus Nomurabacteria bacterium]